MNVESIGRRAVVLKHLTWMIALLVAVVGGLVQIGWLLHIPFLTGIHPGLATMKANTALAFICAGLALALLYYEPSRPRLRRVGQLGAIIVILIGALTLCEYVTGLDL